MGRGNRRRSTFWDSRISGGTTWKARQVHSEAKDGWQTDAGESSRVSGRNCAGVCTSRSSKLGTWLKQVVRGYFQLSRGAGKSAEALHLPAGKSAGPGGPRSGGAVNEAAGRGSGTETLVNRFLPSPEGPTSIPLGAVCAKHPR